MATARVALTVQSYTSFPELGLQLSEVTSDTSNFNRFANVAGDVVFIARNTDAVTRTVQFSYRRRGQAVAQTAVSIAAGKTSVFGPFSSEFGDHLTADAADGDIYVSTSSALVLVSAMKMPGAVRG